MPFAVTVTFTLHPGTLSEFLPHMRANARGAVEDEPGCRQFDIVTDPARPDTVFLYEVYDDADAFAAHTRTPHYAAVGPRIEPLVADKVVQTWTTVEQ